MSTPVERLAQLGLALPAVPAAAGSYAPFVRSGNLVFTAGQLPFVDGALPLTGKVGDGSPAAGHLDVVAPARATELARLCALNILAVVESAVGLDAVTRVVKLVGFVAAAPGFTAVPGVINGASDLMTAVFGEAGRHARSAVGVAELPLGSPVEVEAVVEVR
ncbi:RidA family protein [Nakamurella leprariae]|uniref:RidA family protein n=1 Tax=Nakamurella leprariae TaxID=2803911 RepID=A0A938YGI1_9ACTN|nr:RidA family protein [Nakamurella leprariae]MBM9467390.1 RidA family protein [Nakamurella leprariae]